MNKLTNTYLDADLLLAIPRDGKSLTLDDLKGQVDQAVKEMAALQRDHLYRVKCQLPDCFDIGDFEIRRRK